ncbi:hypothetical protein GCM10029964_045600 [Kibdelosporangium lantanae]
MFVVLVAALVLVGLVVLAVGLRRAGRSARTFARTSNAVNAEVNAATGMLRARRAALRIAVRDRRTNKTIGKVTDA